MLFFILGELFFLYLLSRALTQGIYRLVYLLTTNHHAGIIILSLLFFPGTVVHELSHWIIAEILRVRTGAITLHPIIEKGGVRLGSVALERTDPVRRLIVGLAPVLVGVILVVAITNLYLANGHLGALFSVGHLGGVQGRLPWPPSQESWVWFPSVLINPLTYLYLYVLFSIGNTMFSSKKDLEGFIVVGTVVSIIGLSTYLADLWPTIPVAQSVVNQVVALLTPAITFIVIIDGVLLVIIHGLIQFFQKALKRRIIESSQR